MYGQFLGHYLVKNNLLTQEQLDDVLETKRTTRLKLGFLAVNEGYLTEKEANKINELQKKKDMRFGDIAVKKGFMTQKQLSELLRKQGLAKVLFLQIIVDKGFMTLDALNAAIENYKKDANLTFAQYDAIQSGDITRIAESFLYIEEDDPSDMEDLVAFREFASLFMRNIIRFISSDIRISRYFKINTFNTKYFAKQYISGKPSYSVGLCCNDLPAVADFAKSFAKDVFEEGVDEDPIDLLDAVGEFINCVNGLNLVRLEENETDFNLMPQEYFIDAKIHHPAIYGLPIYINNVRFDLILAFKLDFIVQTEESVQVKTTLEFEEKENKQ